MQFSLEEFNPRQILSRWYSVLSFDALITDSQLLSLPAGTGSHITCVSDSQTGTESRPARSQSLGDSLDEQRAGAELDRLRSVTEFIC